MPRKFISKDQVAKNFGGRPPVISGLKEKITALIVVSVLGFLIYFLVSNYDGPTYDEVDFGGSNKQEQLAIQDFTESFDGAISSYPIIMTLSKKGKTLTGTYTYKRKGLTFKINGEIDSLGNLNINEFGDNGVITGVFKGQFYSEYSLDRIVGNWQRPDGSVILPFSLVETSLNEVDYMKH